jgi:hypothetical protein
MITAEEYCKFLKDAEEELKNYDRLISYRQIELLGATTKTNRPYTDDEYKIMSNDQALAQLFYSKQKLENRLDFVRKRAEWPEE